MDVIVDVSHLRALSSGAVTKIPGDPTRGIGRRKRKCRHIHDAAAFRRSRHLYRLGRRRSDGRRIVAAQQDGGTSAGRDDSASNAECRPGHTSAARRSRRSAGASCSSCSARHLRRGQHVRLRDSRYGLQALRDRGGLNRYGPRRGWSKTGGHRLAGRVRDHRNGGCTSEGGTLSD